MGHQSEIMVEITLTSKDEREFKVDAQVAIMSETVKSMLGIDDPSEDIDPPEAAIPLPAVEGNILELVLKYCTYHHENMRPRRRRRTHGMLSSSRLTTTRCSLSSWRLTTSTSRPCSTSRAKLSRTTSSSAKHRRRFADGSISRTTSHQRRRKRSARRTHGARNDRLLIAVL